MKAKNPASGQGNSNCNPVATEPDPQKKAKLMNVFLKLLMQHVQSYSSIVSFTYNFLKELSFHKL